jgi:hypothetical protein
VSAQAKPISELIKDFEQSTVGTVVAGAGF